VFSEKQRLEWVREFRSVDEAHIIHEPTGVYAINRFRPAVYAKGRDTVQWTNVISEEMAAIERIGGRLEYIDTGTVFHSGELMSGKYLAPRQDQASQ
jgi:glycerol-3-phosphate cytidylyltransferase-like family protein